MLLKRLLLLLIIIFLLGFSCGNEDSETISQGPVESQDEIEVVEEEVLENQDVANTPAKNSRDIVPKKIDIHNLVVNESQGAPDAHKKYLDDELAFIEMAMDSEWKKTAVVGTNNTIFYPGINSLTAEEAGKLSSDDIIPLGSIIPILEKIESPDQDYYGFYFFEKNYNYFYKTIWNGIEGIVFGADLKGLNSSNKTNEITAMFYTQNGIFQEFPPFAGYNLLKKEVKDKLVEEKLAFQEVDKSEYYLSINNPDDMISLYQKAAKDKQQPMFITTDLIAHSLHLFFDKYLQFIEEDFFVPRLKELTAEYLVKIDELEQKAIADGVAEDDNYRQTLHLAKTYFQIPMALLEMSPLLVKKEDEYDRQIKEYVKPDKEKILSLYPKEIVDEINLILNAEGFKKSPNFDYKEDYSQYKPRGHYTKNGILSSYFQTMMWFGRLHFYISIGKKASVDMLDDPAVQLSLKLTPVALLLTEINKEDPSLHNLWRILFDPITALIGMSDDLSFYDLIPFRDKFNLDGFPEWVEDDENIIAAINEASDKLRSPLISGNSVFSAPSESDGDGTPKQPLGWRLFGQRFTYDSFIHQQLSPPRFMPRDFVTGLDIMKVFGSDTADQLLNESEYEEMAGLEKLIDGIEGEFDKMSPEIWSETYYNRVLYQIKAQANFGPGEGFYFTESPAWGIKSMLSSHGTWAALRHDTILYVKQVYAERSGGGDYEATFRTLPIPKAVHYIEPNKNFFEGSYHSIKHLQGIIEKYSMNNELFDQRISSFSDILNKCIEIIDKEYSDESVLDSDLEWIRTLPTKLSKLVVPPGSDYSSYTDDPNKLRGAIIADVYTNADFGEVLEVGVGIPYRIYIPLNDGQGGKRIAIGYTYSYYEFRHPMGDRLTNEQWREWVYGDNPDLTRYQPFWSQSMILPSGR